MINEAIIRNAGGAWYNLPSESNIKKVGKGYKGDIVEFSKVFNGRLVKDPRFCITFSVWRECCPVSHVVISLRHPVSVAESLRKRNGFTLEHGLELWYQYNHRLISNLDGISVVVINYDDFPSLLEEQLHAFLKTTGSGLTTDETKRRIDGFYEPKLNHNSSSNEITMDLPAHIKNLYRNLRAKVVSNSQI
jgi:hypothetical protein